VGLEGKKWEGRGAPTAFAPTSKKKRGQGENKGGKKGKRGEAKMKRK
jgi:hypothetical protein